MRWYLIRIYDNTGNVVTTRCEKASDPREACRLAFGVIYDRPHHNAEYKEIGGRTPRTLSAKIVARLQGPHGWTKIPQH